MYLPAAGRETRRDDCLSGAASFYLARGPTGPSSPQAILQLSSPADSCVRLAVGGADWLEVSEGAGGGTWGHLGPPCPWLASNLHQGQGHPMMGFSGRTDAVSNCYFHVRGH